MKSEKYIHVIDDLKQALVRLMTQKPFAEITVTDLVTEASVSRASFYRNFRSTSDILDLLIDELISALSDRFLPIMNSSDTRKWRDFLFEYIYNVRRHRKLLEDSLSNNISVVFTRINDRVQLKEQDYPYQNISEKYCASAKIGLISTVLIRWFNDGMKDSPEELVNYLMGFITSF